MAKKPRVSKTPLELAQQTYEAHKATYLHASEQLRTALSALANLGYYPSPLPDLRWRLPNERGSRIRRFEIGHGDDKIEGYAQIGLFDDGVPGELFIIANKEGSLVAGLLDGIATIISIALQSGVPLARIVDKLRYTKFHPNGITTDKEIRNTSSVLDFIAHWLELRFQPKEDPSERD
jgi:hypothetical protein